MGLAGFQLTVLYDFDVCVEGAFSPGDVSINWADCFHSLSPEMELAVATIWAAAERSAARSGQQLYSGPLCRLDAYRTCGNTLSLSLSRTDYRSMLGTSRQLHALP